MIICKISANMAEAKKMTPSDFLKQIIGHPVVVKLNSGVDYRGEYFDIMLPVHFVLIFYHGIF